MNDQTVLAKKSEIVESFNYSLVLVHRLYIVMKLIFLPKIADYFLVFG